MFSTTTLIVAYILLYVAWSTWFGLQVALNGKLLVIRDEQTKYFEDLMNYKISPLRYFLVASNISGCDTMRYLRMFWNSSKISGILFITGEIIFTPISIALWVIAIPFYYLGRYVYHKTYGSDAVYKLVY